MPPNAPRIVFLAFAVSLVPAAAVKADFVGLVAERITTDDFGRDLVEELGMPETLRVWRVYAQFQNGSDQLVWVGGVPQIGQFNVATEDGSGFFNHVGQGVGDTPPSTDTALAVDEANYDSWMTIGNSLEDAAPPFPSGAASGFQLVIAVNTPGPNTDPWPDDPDQGLAMAWSLPTTLPDPGDPGGPAVPTPQSLAGNFPGNRVLLAQLVVNEGTVVQGQIGVGVVPELDFYYTSFTIDQACEGDTNGDGVVDVVDIINVILAWGTDDPGADVTGDGTVNVLDLITVVLNRGPCK